MPPKLFYNEMCPQSRAVLMVAAATDIHLNLQEVDVYSRKNDTELLQVNIQQTVPTLTDEDFTIWGSHTIIGYLLAELDFDDLYPKNTKGRALVNQFLHFDSGVLLPRVNTIINSIVVENEKEISTKQISAITESYKFFDKFLQDKSFLLGENLSVADLCCVSTISTATIITPISTEKYPNLSAWYRTCKNLAYYESTNGMGLNKLDALVELKLGRPRTKDFCE